MVNLEITTDDLFGDLSQVSAVLKIGKMLNVIEYFVKIF